jgi:predicted anti-sigma-YlaC factor YlaD
VSAEHDDLRRLLGGYLLGGLDEADLDRIDAHLRDCDDCRAELDQLAAVPELLKRLPDAQRVAGDGAQAPISLATRPSAENVETLLHKMRAERSRESRTARVRWLAAAAVVLVAAAIGFGVVRGSGQQTAPEALPSPQLVTAQFEPSAGSGMTGEATLTPKLWGVSVSLDVTKLSGAGPFLCQVRDHGGGVEQAAIWGPTPTGNAKVIGASSIQLHDVSAVTVADQAGHVLGTAHLE